jgi:hypothetical protein
MQANSRLVIVGPEGLHGSPTAGSTRFVRVNPATERVKRYPLPDDAASTNLNTATFDERGALWFTGQSGICVTQYSAVLGESVLTPEQEFSSWAKWMLFPVLSGPAAGQSPSCPRIAPPRRTESWMFT